MGGLLEPTLLESITESEATPEAKEPIALFDLPAEVRLIIYEHSFKDLPGSCLPSTIGHHEPRNLFQICRQIRKEANAHFSIYLSQQKDALNPALFDAGLQQESKEIPAGQYVSNREHKRVYDEVKTREKVWNDAFVEYKALGRLLKRSRIRGWRVLEAELQQQRNESRWWV